MIPDVGSARNDRSLAAQPAEKTKRAIERTSLESSNSGSTAPKRMATPYPFRLTSRSGSQHNGPGVTHRFL